MRLRLPGKAANSFWVNRKGKAFPQGERQSRTQRKLLKKELEDWLHRLAGG
jgi:hypothetical protein